MKERGIDADLGIKVDVIFSSNMIFFSGNLWDDYVRA